MGAAEMGIPGIWGQEGQGPRQGDRKAPAAAAALYSGQGSALRCYLCMQEENPALSAVFLPQPLAPVWPPCHMCTHRLPRNTGPALPAGAFYSCPYCDMSPHNVTGATAYHNPANSTLFPSPAQSLRVALVYWLRLLSIESSPKNFP